MNRLTKYQAFLNRNRWGRSKAPSPGVPMGDTVLKLPSNRPAFYHRRPVGQELLRHRPNMRNRQSSYIKTISSLLRGLSCHNDPMRAVGHGTG